MRSSRPASVWDRVMSPPRPLWVRLAIVLAAYLPSLAAARALGQTDLLMPGTRALLAAPTVIAYIFLLGPAMAPIQDAVFQALRPLVPAEAADLDARLLRARTVSPWQEFAAVACGFAFGVVLIGFPSAADRSWPTIVVAATGYVMLGLLGWTAFISITETRVLNSMLQLPLRVDPLDLKPFEPIGRWSMAIALAFVGGILIGLILGSYGAEPLMDPRFWILFLPLSFVPVLLFYLNMRPTHRVLAGAKQRELSTLRHQLHEAYRRLLQMEQQGQAAGDLPAVIAALGSFERALAEARTWPYNTAILRTLLVSVLIPIGTVLIRPLLERIFG
jgi:hypothetical protein